MSFPPPLCTFAPVHLLPSPGSTFLAPYSTTATGRGIRRRRRRALLPNSASSSSDRAPQLVTFLGKGGSGKTTASVFAAQHYAMVGLRTCLVIQTQDPFADYLLNCKIGSSPTACNDNLFAVRLETTKLLLGPLDRLKLADARLKMTQGVLEGVVGEELAVLPAMDSILGAFALEQKVGFLRNVSQNENQDRFDVVVYDGMSTDETLRLLGAASKTRLYLKYLRNLAEKTDLGRLVAPSILGLVDEAMNLSSNRSYMSGRTSSELWDILEMMLEQGSSAFSDPCKFGCILMVDPMSSASVNSALRYWGCTIQAGSQISGAVGFRSPPLSRKSEEVRSKFEPLPFSYIPHLPMAHPADWKSIMLDITSQDARSFFSSLARSSNDEKLPVKFDLVNKMITLFMPGFDKSEIKLYQYRGGSELLVEAGDQRRVIRLPPKIQGKVGGAKFIDRSLIITLR